MIASALRLAGLASLVAVTLALGACANVQVSADSPTIATVEALRAANLAPAQAGTFRLAPGKDSSLDNSLGGLRGSSMKPDKGSWSQLLKDTLITELKAAGLFDPASRRVIEGQLTDSRVDAAIGTGTARLAARFTVSDSGKQVFDKELAVDAEWESSFMGAVAIPAAINHYGALYRSLIGKLVDDPDFRRAMAK